MCVCFEKWRACVRGHLLEARQVAWSSWAGKAVGQGGTRGAEKRVRFGGPGGTCHGRRVAGAMPCALGRAACACPMAAITTWRAPLMKHTLRWMHSRTCNLITTFSLPLALHLGPPLSRPTTTTRLAEPRGCGLSHTAITFSKQHPHPGPPQQQRRTSTTAVFSVVRRPWISPLSSAMCWLRTPQTR